MYQVTAVALYILLKQAYSEYLSSNVEDEILSEKDWITQQRKKEPQFLFWHQILEYILLVLQFVKAIRLGNFQQHIDTLELIMPWLFALDHHNYAKCLPVYLRDMCTLEEIHPDVHTEFLKGNFVGQKSLHPFCKLGLDQTYEQLIGVLKGDGGIIGIVTEPAALRRHMIAGTELSRLIQEFEASTLGGTEMKKHHEQYQKFQSTFFTHVPSDKKKSYKMYYNYKSNLNQYICEQFIKKWR